MIQKIQNSYLTKGIIALLAVIPAIWYFKLFFQKAQNIPHWDDYAIIRTIDHLQNASFLEAIKLFFAQHNEHRIVLTRLLAWFITLLNGSLDFKTLAFLGNLFLLGILYVLWQYFKSKGHSVWLFLPIIPILFHFRLWENTYWGMASVQNFGVVFFMLLCFWQFNQHKIPFLFSFLAVFTSGNAIVFLPIIGFLVLIFNKERPKLKLWLLWCLFLIILYFFNYTKPEDLTGFDFNNILGKLKGFWVMLGSFVEIGAKGNFDFWFLFSLVAGLTLTLLFLLLNWRFYSQNKEFDSFLWAIAMFVFGSALAVAVSRYNFGEYVFLVGRYKIYSILLVIIVYFSIINYMSHSNRLYFSNGLVILLFGMFLMSSFYNSNAINDYQNAEIASFYNGWRNNENIILKNKKNSCFQYKSGVLDRKIVHVTGYPKKLYNTKVTIDTLNKILNFTSNIHFDLEKIGQGIPYLLFKGKRNYIFANENTQLPSKKDYFLGNKAKYIYGFTAKVPLTELNSDAYILDILWVGEHENSLLKTNYYQEIKGIKKEEPKVNWEH